MAGLGVFSDAGRLAEAEMARVAEQLVLKGKKVAKAARPAAEAVKPIVGMADGGVIDLNGMKLPSPVKIPQNATPYTMRGSDIIARMQGIPSAAEIAGKKDIGTLGSGYTGQTVRGRSLLPEHESSGYLTGETSPPVAADWSSLQGKTILGLVGDPTGRKIVTNIDGTPLANPVMSQAGAEFADIGDNGWASAKSAMSSKLNAASQAADPYLMFLNMGDQSGDFAVHTGQMLGEAFKSAQIASKDIPMVDDAIRNIPMSTIDVVTLPDGTEKKVSRTIRPFADFKSVVDPEHVSQYIQALPNGTMRAAFVKGLDRAGLQKVGVPDIGSLRMGLANPDMIGRDWLTAGYRGFTPDVSSGLLSTTPDTHATYDTMIKKIGPSETFDAGGNGVPANLLFSDFSEGQRAKGTGGQLVPTTADYKVYESSPYKSQQLMDERAINMVSTFTEIEKSHGREAALRYAKELLSGGRITGSMIDAAKRANAPKWLVAALAVPTAGLLAHEPRGQY
jgi:hypothetical protein